jgi:hypothetical protein
MNEEFKERIIKMNERIYKKLSYFYEKKVPIHFCLSKGYGWKNGNIKKLNESDYTMILDEIKEGELHFLLEEINLNSIQAYKKPEEIIK